MKLVAMKKVSSSLHLIFILLCWPAFEHFLSIFCLSEQLLICKYKPFYGDGGK